MSEFEADDVVENEDVAGAEEQVEGAEEKIPSKMNREVIENIPVTLAIEVGRASLKIRDLMRLTQGLSLIHI